MAEQQTTNPRHYGSMSFHEYIREIRDLPQDSIESDLEIKNNPPTEKERRDWEQLQQEYNTQKDGVLVQEKAQATEQAQHDALIKLASNKRREATERVVVLIHDYYNIYTTRDDSQSEMWIYQDGIYVPNGRSYIREFTRQIFDEAYTNALANEVITKVEADTYIDQDMFFNSEIVDEIVVDNGVLNIYTGELSEFSPDKIFFNKLPVQYDSELDCPLIKKFFSEILAHPKEDMLIMQELFGYLLLKEYKFEKSFMFFGNGRNGKSKTFGLIRALLGEDNVVSVKLQEFDENQYAAGELFHKMVNIGGDISGAPLKETSMFKALTGRDQVTANRKYLSSIHFVNYAKMLFAANELPYIFDSSKGFWMRWLMLDFPYEFVPQKVYDTLSDEDRVNKKLDDPDMLSKISTSEELSGLLNWALEGLSRLLDNNGFSSSRTSRETQRLWLRRSDSFLAFCMDHVEQDWDGRVEKGELRKEYVKYCRENNIKAKSDRIIKSVLTTEYGADTERQRTSDSDNYYWSGIRLVRLQGAVMSVDVGESLGVVQRVKDVVSRLDYGDGVGVDDMLDGVGISEEELGELLDKLTNKGVLFSPKPGRYKLL